VDSDAMLSGLEQLLSYADHMRAKGCLEILTMDEYARQLDRELVQATSETVSV
jgi:hypothetical protein